MTLKLYKPSGPKQTSWRIRGYMGERWVERSARTNDRAEAEKALLELQQALAAEEPLVWRQIPGYSRYEISNNGQVRRRAPIILKQTRRPSGHMAVTIYSDDGKQWRTGVHHLVARAFLGGPPEGKPYACHKNGIADENTRDNLYWGSATDNAADAVKHWAQRPILGRNLVAKKLSEKLSRKELRKKAFRPNWLDSGG